MIDLGFVRQLLDLLNESNAQTIEIRKWWWSTTIRISKSGEVNSGGPVTYQLSAPAAAAPTPASSPASAAEGAAAAGAEPATAAHLSEIKSPMVGTFYAQPEPGSEPYVRVGSRISPGKTLCIIEAMKIMNPLDSEVAGVIKDILVEDSQPVEFGQVLFRVDTHA